MSEEPKPCFDQFVADMLTRKLLCRCQIQILLPEIKCPIHQEIEGEENDY